MYQNDIRFNCSNYHRLSMIYPDYCYNCYMRKGYPRNLGGDDNCENFVKIGKR